MNKGGNSGSDLESLRYRSQGVRIATWVEVGKEQEPFLEEMRNKRHTVSYLKSGEKPSE